MTRRPLLLFVLAALAFVPVVMRADRSQDVEKTIYINVIDAAGKPVKDLTASQLGVKEDNVIREITSVKPATEPLSVIVLADTTKNAGGNAMTSGVGTSGNTGDLTRDIRTSLLAFVRDLNAASPESQITLMEFGQAAITIVKPTSKLPDIEKGIGRLTPKPDAGSVLLEALIDASNQLIKAPNARRAIVALNVEPGDEQSQQQPIKVLESMKKSHASLWSVSLQRGEIRNVNRDQALSQLSRGTGGTRDYILGPSALETMLKTYALLLTSQYEVTYKRPASATAVQQIMMGLTVPNRLLYNTLPPQ